MLLRRMIRAARLDPALYEEVEADTRLTSQAARVVAIVAVGQGLSSVLAALMAGASSVSQVIPTLVLAISGPFIGWLVWSSTAYWIGTSLFNRTATLGEMFRTLGFAQAPGVLGSLAFIPILGGLVGFIGGIWVLVAGIVAIRRGLDFTPGKALVTAIVGWLIWWMVLVGLILAFGMGAMVLRG
jgi:hypothetical protein